MRFECLSAVPKKKPNTSLTSLKFLKELGSKFVKSAIKTRAIPPRAGLPNPVQAAMKTVVGPLPQRKCTPRAANSIAEKEIAVHFSQNQKTLNIVLSVHNVLYTFALNIQKPMQPLV